VLAEAKITTVYGGGGIGSMGRLADGVLESGGQVVGILPRFMAEIEWGHARLTELQLVADMRERKRLLLEGADAVVALPGGCGTYEELFEAITLKRLGLYLEPIVLVNTRGYFDLCVSLLEQCVTEGFMHPYHRAMWQVVDTPEQVLDAIANAPVWSPQARDFAVQKQTPSIFR